MGETRDLAEFGAQLGSQFRIHIDKDRFVEAELIEAAALAKQDASVTPSACSSFSLLFDVERGIDLPQQTYQVHHESLGELILFLVPVGAGQLESVFS